MDCNEVCRWIWEVLEAPASPAGALGRHLRACTTCQAEFEARRCLDLDLRDLRAEEQEEPSEAVNRRVLSALAVPDDGNGARPRAQLGLVAEMRPPQDSNQRSGGWRDALRHSSLILALAFALAASLLLGFNLGQATFHQERPIGPAQSFSLQPRSHQVGLSMRAMEALEDGNTYMLIGPRGGPYQVIDVATWDRAKSVGPTVNGRDELVLAVGPAGGWSRGKTVVLADLAGSGAEILARRALSP